MYIILSLSAFFNTICAALCGTAVWLKKEKSPLNKMFLVLCAVTFLWSLFYFFPLVSHNYDLSKLSFDLLHIPLIFFATVNLHFICTALGIQEKQKNIIQTAYAFCIVFLIVHLFTNYFVAYLEPKFSLSYWIVPGVFYHLWTLLWFSQILYALYLLIKANQTSVGIIKEQNKYLFIGSAVTFIFSSTNLLLTYDVTVPPLLNILSSAQLIVFAYTVKSYRYLHLSVRILKFLKQIFFISLAAAVGYYFYYNAAYILGTFHPEHTQVWQHPELIGIIVFFLALKVITYFEPFHRFFQITTFERLQRSIEAFIHNNKIYKNIDELNQDLKVLFSDMNYISEVSILTDKKEVQKKLKESYQHVKNNIKYIDRDELQLRAQKQEKYDKKLLAELLENKIVLVFPLMVNLEVVGLLVVGEKPYQSFYSHHEIKHFSDLAKHLALKLNMVFYNQNLHQQVKEKTKSIREKNKQLKDSYKKLQELDKAKDSFLAITSHELRTPMTVIKGYSDFLIKEKFGTLNPKQKKFVSKIAKNTEQLLDLVNDILSISTIESGKMEFHERDFNVEMFLEEMTQTFQVAAEEKNINLLSVYEPKTKIIIHSDPDKLEMIFNNLISNAIKFTENDGEVIVSFHGEVKPGFFRFSVSDNGIGIPKEKQSDLFQKFKQIGNYLQKSYTGTGLGLSIVKKLIIRLDGNVWVESETQKGAKFIFDLPIKS